MDTVSYLLGKKNGGGSGTTNYNDLSNKPSINDVTLSGNKTSSDLGIQEELVSGTNIKTINGQSILGSGNIDTEVIQYSTLPTASASNLGKIVQYTGTTTNDYTNGYFYQCVTDGQDPATYSWENVNVQASSGGSSNQIFYGNYGWYLYLNDDIDVGIYITSSGSNDLELYGLNEQRERISMYFGFFYVVKKYSECSDGDTFIIYIDRYGGTGKLTKASNEKGYNGYTNGGNWTNKNRVLQRDNTETYTPTGDYNPATKKYVDDLPTTYTGYDATKTQVLKNINGTLTWVDEV